MNHRDQFNSVDTHHVAWVDAIIQYNLNTLKKFDEGARVSIDVDHNTPAMAVIKLSTVLADSTLDRKDLCDLLAVSIGLRANYFTQSPKFPPDSSWVTHESAQ